MFADVALEQALWQLYLLAPPHVRIPMFNEIRSNAVYQVYNIYLIYQVYNIYLMTKQVALLITFVDVTSRYKEAEALTDKT